MENITDIINWFLENKANLYLVVTSIIGTASLIVKLTPTLKDDNALKAVIKFVGKFVALDKYGPNG